MDMTEAFQLMPEQSTAAIIIHHPEAKYYAVRGMSGEAAPNNELHLSDTIAQTVDEAAALGRAAGGEISLAEARSDT